MDENEKEAEIGRIRNRLASLKQQVDCLSPEQKKGIISRVVALIPRKTRISMGWAATAGLVTVAMGGDWITCAAAACVALCFVETTAFVSGVDSNA